ncbi:MAG: chromosome segregation protein SMC [Oligoflexia bacterium]|nr:chromosome segregation protein SMC [Oligoflexia bacterium]MBF0365802.1 chromosome segregation protein SMC [Oligoflexia bacterium]
MKLKKLIVHGFKSFKDKTTINFDMGITGIVGPNGCGKSNIVDALFWVMGEQSAKHLRGTSMKDVIFAGSSAHPPASFAEVSLVIENDTNRYIHIGEKVCSPAEIQLTRKLYRNGDSEYRINNLPARLKDIQEVFLDTGVGAKSYSIIAQGEINRLIQANPQEKRVMIEEVAGITKFKLRKKESLRKMEQTTNNLSRLNDLKAEVGRQLQVLQKQSEKASKARTLKEQIKKNELLISSHREYELLERYRKDFGEIDEKNQQLEQARGERSIIETKNETRKFERDELNLALEEQQREYNQAAKELALSEERLNYLHKSREDKAKLLIEKSREGQELREEEKEREQKFKIFTAELAKLDERAQGREEMEKEVEHLSYVVEELNDKISERSDEIKSLKSEVESKKSEKRELDLLQMKNSSRLEEISSKLTEITDTILLLEMQITKRNEETSDLQSSSDKSRQELAALEEVVRNLDNEIAALVELQDEVEESYLAKSKEHIQSESKLQSLKELQQLSLANSDNEEKTKKLHQVAAQIFGGSENYSLLGNLIRCEDKYAGGVQLALENLLDLFILHQDAPPPLDFNDIDVNMKILQLAGTRSPHNLADKISSGPESEIYPFSKMVSLQNSEGNSNNLDLDAINSLLDRCYLVSEVTPAILANVKSLLEIEKETIILASFDGRTIVSTLWGKMVCHIHGESASTLQEEDGALQGVIARNNQIAKYEERYQQLSLELPKLQEENSILKNSIKEKQALRTSKAHELAELKTKFTLSKSKIENNSTIQKGEIDKVEYLKKKKGELSQQKITILEQDEETTQKLQDLEGVIDESESSLSERGEELDFIEEDYNTKKEELLSLRADLQSLEGHRASLRMQLQDIQSQLAKIKMRLESNETSNRDYEREITDTLLIIDKIKEANLAMAKDLSAKEATLMAVKDRFMNFMNEMEEEERKIKMLERKINKLEKETLLVNAQLEQMRSEEEQLARNIFEKYRVNLRKVVGDALALGGEDFSSLIDISSTFHRQDPETLALEAIPEESYHFIKKGNQEINNARDQQRKLQSEFQELGEVNWTAIEECDRQQKRHDFLIEQETELSKSLSDLQNAIIYIDEKSKLKFKEAFGEINERFQKVFPILFGGGSASLELITNSLDESETGVEIVAWPPGKKMQNINLLSGGEKAMTALGLIFSTFLVRPSPFCLLDEVDAPLDDANVVRFNDLLREMSSESQFILITHNKKTMELNDLLYGVTMQEPGVSKAVSIRLQ